MGASTVQNVSQILMDVWEKSDKNALYKNTPLLGMIPKDREFVGKNIHVPLRYSPEPGGSANFQRAQANKNPSKWGDFVVTRAKDYALGSLSTELYRSAKGGKDGSIVDALIAVKNGLQNTALRSVAISLYRNGGGARAQVASGMASNTLQLVNVDDIVNFEAGMQLDGSATDGTTGAAIVGGTASIIVSIDRDLGTITNDATANWNAATGINGIAANGYLFRGGDFGATIVGLDGWIPPGSPSATLFFGQNRSLDTERLGGCRVTAATQPTPYTTVEGALLALLKRVYRAGGSPDHVFLHPEDYLTLILELGSKREYCESRASEGIDIGYTGVRIQGAGGPAKVFADPNCQKGTAWALTMDTWCFRTLGEPMGILDEDGKTMLRESGDDALEMRLATYGNTTCDAPAYNGRAALPTA